MFEQSNELFEIVRSSFLAYLIIALPIFVSISPVLAAKEFSTFRLQQFELHGNSYGTSGSILNLETRILPGSPIVASPRRCYVVKLIDLTVGMYRELLKHSVGGIFVIVPSDFTTINDNLREQIQELEQTMLEETTTVPVYFVVENEEVEDLYSTIKKNADILGPTSSGLETLIHHVHGNGVQVVSSLSTPKAVTDAQITSIQGNLIGSKVNNNFPILVCTHYDSMSPAAELSFGGDSNASGTVLLLELARIFSHLYSSRGSAAGKAGGRQSNSLLFLLSGGGHFNYGGTQKYLEDQIDSLEHSDLQNTRLALCLDSLAKNKNQLYIHVSRSIREGTMLHAFIENIKEIASQLYPDLKVEVIQRKVKTDNLLSWEHEKFHLKKINAITLSSHKDASEIKPSLLDTKESVDAGDLVIKTHVIAEALAASIYNVSSNSPVFSGSLGVSETSLTSMLDFVASEPRSAQLLATKQNKFVQTLRSILARYTHETSLFYMKPDKRDANLVFYDNTAGTITAYDVKPAVFDLILSIAVCAYIIVIYAALKNFHILLEYISVRRPESNSSNGVSGNHVSKAKVQ